MLKPKFNYILLEKKEKESSLTIEDNTYEMSTLEVVSVGEEVKNFKKGDRVILGNTQAFTKELGGKTYIIIEDRNIIAIE